MKYYIIAGEASGDLHGSNLMKELRKADPQAEFRCWGGDLMKSAGGDVVRHYRDLAFMGFTEVVLNLRTILSNLSFCKQDILAYQPTVVILIDYPGFNLRIASFVKGIGIKVFYYISPQIWAWKESRIKTIKSSVDRMFVILPFEKEFYAKHHYEVDFVGHPLLDVAHKTENDPAFRQLNKLNEKPILAILPGSRVQEVNKMLPVMLQAGISMDKHQIVIAAAPSLTEEFYHGFLQAYPDVRILFNKTYSLLEAADSAMITSGTATLEAALFGVPEVVCYKGSYLSYKIARSLVKVKYISLVNLIMDREVVKELIQEEFNPGHLIHEVLKLQENGVRMQMKNEFQVLREKLGGPGAAKRTAELMIKYLA